MLPTLRAPAIAHACASAAVLLGVLAVGGCAGGDRAASTPSGAPDRGDHDGGDHGRGDQGRGSSGSGGRPGSTDGGGPEVPAFAGVHHRLPTGHALHNDPALYEQVTLTRCAATASGWRATGSATNPGADHLDVAVLVFFTDAQARVVDSASTTVSVPAGSTSTWTAEREFDTSPGTTCAIRAVAPGS